MTTEDARDGAAAFHADLLEELRSGLRETIRVYLETFAEEGPEGADRIVWDSANQLGHIMHQASQGAAHMMWAQGYSAGHNDALMGARHPTPNPVPDPNA